MEDIILKIKNILLNMTSAQVALLSVIVTLFLFFLGKRKENQLRLYETREKHYIHLLELFKKIFASADNVKKMPLTLTKEQFYEVGSSLAIYGSKKLYKKYCLYRELSVNSVWQNYKFYDASMTIYLIGEMYQIMRKEIGLNSDFLKIECPDILFFFLNDITKPIYRKKYYIYKFNLFRIKLIMFYVKLENLLFVSWVCNYIIKPIFLFIFMPILTLVRMIFIKPIKAIKTKLTDKNKTPAP